MAFVNVWFGMRKNAADVVKTRLRWDEEADGKYTGPVTNREHRLFRLMADQPNVERLFRVARAGGNDWVLWSISFDEPGDVLRKVKSELDALATKYPTQIAIVGAWFWDGRQVGTRWKLDAEGNRVGTTGAPTYPIPTAQLLKFMPKVWNGDEPPTYSAATELADVNLLLGQSPRRFV